MKIAIYVLIDILVWASASWLIVWQIMLPAMYGTPFLPFFRKAPREAEQTLAAAREGSDIRATLAEAERLNQPTAASPPVPPQSRSRPTTTATKRKQ